MSLRLHGRGRFRRWLGTRLGGEFELGDRVWRRVLHGLCAGVLLYYLLPERFFLFASNEEVLLLALVFVLALEALRQFAHLEMPTIRPYEQRWVASYAFFALAIVVSILVFPEPIAAAVILGTALVDPLAGELRIAGARPAVQWVVPILVYFGLAFTGLYLIGRLPPVFAVILAAVASPIAVAVERPKSRWFDDDLAMTFVPAIAMIIAAFVIVLEFHTRFA